MSLSNYGAQQWAGILFGIGALPEQFFTALCTGEPGQGWDGTVVNTVEPDDGVYERQPLAMGSDWTLSDGGFVINAAELTYPVPIADWGQITHFALLDDISTGNLWAWGEFVQAIFIPTGYPPVLAVGSLFFAMSDQLASIAE